MDTWALPGVLLLPGADAAPPGQFWVAPVTLQQADLLALEIGQNLDTITHANSCLRGYTQE